MTSGPDLNHNSLAGLWRRDRIEFADGRIDTSTKVFWGQTPSLFVDVRIPAHAADLTRRESLSAYAKDELAVLAEQKGFAGHIRLQGQQCEWVRTLDYQPASGRPDRATVRNEGETLYETGDSSSTLGASYQEVFRRISRGDRACVAAELVKSDGQAIKSLSGPGGILVILDDWFLFAEPRPQPLPSGSNLASLVGAATHQSACSYLDCEYSLGRLDHSGVPWIIELSTLPFRRGRRLFPAVSTAKQSGDSELTVALPEATLNWRIAESNLAPAELSALFLLQ